jgi:hypothetical protein
MTRFTLLLCLFISVSSSLWANPRCLKLEPAIRDASHKYIASDYPVHYNIATAEKETSCRWRESLDGHRSIGYFQLTPKFLDPMLRPLFPDYTKPYSKDHFYAFAYYLNTLIKSNPVPQLWIVYQRYNGGNWVIRECRRAGAWEWGKCLQKCRRGNVCVWRVGTECKQYRSACEINYEYSLLIYKYAEKYRRAGDGRWRYW